MPGLLDRLKPNRAQVNDAINPLMANTLMLLAAPRASRKLAGAIGGAAKDRLERIGRGDERAITETMFDLMGGPLARGLLAAKKATPATVSAFGATGSRYDDAVKSGAQRMNVSEDVYKNLEAEGLVSPQVPPIGVSGRELQFPSGYSKGLKIPVADLEYMDQTLTRRDPKKMGPRDLQIEMEGLLGKTLVPMPGDRTSRDVITGFMGQKIKPYQVEGGYAYMPDKGGWASAKSVIGRYKTMFDELGGQGVSVGTPMSGPGSDYAKAGIDLMYRRFDIEGMPKKTKKALKDEINIEINANNRIKIEDAQKKAKKDGVPYEEPELTKPFKGFDGNERTRFNEEPELRKVVMQALDKDRSRKLPGAPDPVAIRHAITDDRFRELTRGQGDPLSGFDFMSFPAGQKLTKAPHSSYESHISGDYLGGLSTPVPRSLLFPDFTRDMYRQNKPVSRWNYMFDRKKPKQLVTPELVEGVLDYQKKMSR